jgi:hypothetical protein
MARQHQDIDRILQSCLDAIQGDGETIDSVLTRYPDLEESLRPQLEAYLWLWSVKSELDPRPDYVTVSRGRLMAQIKQAELGKRSSPLISLENILGKIFTRRSALQFAFALLLLVVFIVGTSSVALASRNSLPGEGLYPVKLAQERVRLLLSFSAEKDAQLHAEFAQERLSEIQALVLKGRYQYLGGTFARYEQEVSQSVDSLRLAAKNNLSVAGTLAAELAQVLSRQTHALSALSGNVPPANQDQVENALAITIISAQTVDDIMNEISVPDAPRSSSTPTPAIGFSNTSSPSSSATDTQTSNEDGGEIPAGTPEPAILPTFSASAPPAPTKALKPPSRPTPTPTFTPTKTPKPTKVKPKPTNTHRPPKPSNTHKPPKDRDN